MERRTLLKLSLLTPLFFKSACKNENQNRKKAPFATDTNTVEPKKESYHPETLRSFEFLEVEGSYRAIGYQVGKRFAKNIENVMRLRSEWLNKLTTTAQSGSGKKYSDALLDIVKKKLPRYIEELEGMAEGSGIDFNKIWLMSIQSELGSFSEENPGCSTIYYNDDNHNWLFHNEDGHDAYGENMFVLKASPPSGVSFVTLVYPGIIPGVGPSLNDHGIIETTNYIGSVKPEVGIPRYFLGRAILEALSLDEAIQIASTEPRAYPWHHNLGAMENGEYVSVETLPDGTIEKRIPGEGFYLHTNHTTGESTIDYQYQDLEYKNSSSTSRYDVLSKYISNNNSNIEKPGDILKWLGSREGAPYSPCRIPQEGIPGRTLGTAWFDLNKGTYRLYKGTPDNSISGNMYVDYKFRLYDYQKKDTILL